MAANPRPTPKRRSQGTKLREARLKKNMSQTQLAERLQMSPQAIGHYETGLALPSPDRAAQIEKILGLQPGEVMASTRGPGTGGRPAVREIARRGRPPGHTTAARPVGRPKGSTKAAGKAAHDMGRKAGADKERMSAAAQGGRSAGEMMGASKGTQISISDPSEMAVIKALRHMTPSLRRAAVEFISGRARA